MGKALVFVVLLVILLAVIEKAVRWFQYTKHINIIPAAFVEMIAVILFAFNYGGESMEEIVWVCVSVAVVIAITVFNLIKYGVKNGILASGAELLFSIAIALAVLGILVSRSKKTKHKRFGRN